MPDQKQNVDVKASVLTGHVNFSQYFNTRPLIRDE